MIGILLTIIGFLAPICTGSVPVKSGESPTKPNVVSKAQTLHTVNFSSEMGKAKHVSGKKIFCSMNVYKIRGKRILEIVHCPFEMPAN